MGHCRKRPSPNSFTGEREDIAAIFQIAWDRRDFSTTCHRKVAPGPMLFRFPGSSCYTKRLLYNCPGHLTCFIELEFDAVAGESLDVEGVALVGNQFELGLHGKRYHQRMLSLEGNRHRQTHYLVFTNKAFEEVFAGHIFGRQAVEDDIFHGFFERRAQSVDIAPDISKERDFHMHIELFEKQLEGVIVVVLEWEGHRIECP